VWNPEYRVCGEVVMFPLIPLAAGGEIVGVIIGVITVVSWIFNIISQHNQQQQQRQAANAQRARTAQGNAGASNTRREVEDFVARQRIEKKRKRSQERSESPRPQGKSPAGRPVAPPPLPGGDDSVRRPVGGSIASRHVHTSDLGAGVRQSVREHLVDHALSQTVSRDMQPQVSSSVQSHLGSFTAERQSPHGSAPADSSPAGSATSAQSVVRLFRNPATLRQSMMVNLILSKPVSLASRPSHTTQR